MNGSRHTIETGRKINTTKRPSDTITSAQAVGKKIEKLKENGHVGRVTNVNENCFVSPAVITVKKIKRLKSL